MQQSSGILKKLFSKKEICGGTAAALLLVGVGTAPAHASEGSFQVQRTWGTDGRVAAILQVGDRLYIGGSFDSVTDRSGHSYPVANLAVFIPATGTFDTSWRPQPNGAVTALAAGGAQQLYIGGKFTAVGGQPHAHVARVNTASGSLDTTWPTQANRAVRAIQVANGSVYLGGTFGRVADAKRSSWRPRLARVSAASGALDRSWKPSPDRQVRALAVSADGTRLYVGGEFTRLFGSSHGRHLAAVDLPSGTLDPAFRPQPYNRSSRPAVYDFAFHGADLLVAAGGSGGACASVDPLSGTLKWSQHTNGNVQAVALVGDAVLCGGHFNGAGSFGGERRYKLGIVDADSGAVLPYAPRINSALGVWSLAGTAQGVAYLGGDFTKVDGTQQQHFASLLPG